MIGCSWVARSSRSERRKVVLPAPRKPVSISIGRSATTDERGARSAVSVLCIGWVQEFFRSHKLFGVFSITLQPAQGDCRFDPSLLLGLFAVLPIVLLSVSSPESCEHGVFIGDDPIEEGERGLVDLTPRRRVFDVFFLPRAWDGSGLSRTPDHATLPRTDEEKATALGIPSSAGAVEFDLSLLPLATVAACSLQAGRGAAKEALVDEEVALRSQDILSPEKHLLLDSLGKIAQEVGSDGGAVRSH